MREFSFTPQGVCSETIRFRLDEFGRIWDIYFEGGCYVCRMTISRLLDGKYARQAVEKLEGIECRLSGTSCPYQLARFLVGVLDTIAEER